MADTVSPYDDEVADPYAADDTKNPHEETEGDEEATDEASDETPRRQPGRPKKTAET